MRILRSKQVLRTPIFTVEETTAQDHDGFEIHRFVVAHQGSAVVLPVDAEGRVLLVSQFRLPVQGKIWELAAGRIDQGEKPLAAAKRELLEETGLRARNWKRLATMYPTPGYVSELMHLYLATDLTQGDAQPMEDERIETRWFSRAELEKRIDKGRLPDGKTLAGLLLYWRSLDAAGS
jgi:ADP-ribose pyrophosphatase